jgi:gliding motility-associated-like protein
MSKYCILLFLLFSASFLDGQELISNGSFEGLVPILNKVPLRWYICSDDSTPDIQPSTSKKPTDFGTAYLGLVARVFVENKPEQNGTVESVFQQLHNPLDPGREYRLSLYLAHDPNHTTLAQEIAGPGKLKIYIGKDFCDDYRLIWTSEIISHESWEKYEVFFQAECYDQFIELKADFGDSINYDFNYLMIDSVALKPSNKAYQDSIDCTFNPDSIPEDTIDVAKFPCKIYVPTAFSPNHDGLNDMFRIYGDCNIKTYRLQIFNRWGDKVFQSTDRYLGWSGYWLGVMQHPDVYLYQLIYEYIDENGSSYFSNQSGTLTLLH